MASRESLTHFYEQLEYIVLEYSVCLMLLKYKYE